MSTRRSYALAAALSLPVVGLGMLALTAVQPGSTDDLFVVLVYARNLLEHGAFFHEAGEGPLEGFTSPLDLGLKTLALSRDPADGVRAAWSATTLVYGLALLAGLAAALRWAVAWPGVLAATALALTFSPGLAEGTTYVLETPLVALLLALGALVTAGPPGPIRAGLLAVVLTLARPELALVALVWACGSPRERALVGAIVGLLVIVLARWLVFGRLVPNSFVAKTSDSQWIELQDGARYVAEFALSGPGPFLVLLAAVTLPVLAALARPEATRLACAAPVTLAAVLVSGGDGYEGARLLAPTAWLTLLGLGAVAAGSGRWIPRAAVGVLLVVGLAGLIGVTQGVTGRARSVASGGLDDSSFARERVALAHLAQRLPIGATLASRHLQMAEYYEPDLGFLDLTGLNESWVAQRSEPGSVAFGRTSLEPALEARAEAIHLHHVLLSDDVLARRPLAAWLEAPLAERAAILGDPLPMDAGDDPVGRRLAVQYRAVTLLNAGGPGLHLNLLVRRDLAEGWVGTDGVLVAEDR